MGFFRYYAFEFDFVNRAICIHVVKAKPTAKSELKDLRCRNWRICVQDPFELDHDLE